MGRRREPPTIYRSATHYTPDELRAAEIADLETDVRCAERDNQPEYAEECRQKLARLREKPQG